MTVAAKRSRTRATKETPEEIKARRAEEAAQFLKSFRRGKAVKGADGEPLSKIAARKYVFEQLKLAQDGKKSTESAIDSLNYATAEEFEKHKKWYTKAKNNAGSTRQEVDEAAEAKGGDAAIDGGDKGGQIGHIFSLLSTGRIDLKAAKAQAKTIIDYYEEGSVGANGKSTSSAFFGDTRERVNAVLNGINANLVPSNDGGITLNLPKKAWLTSDLLEEDALGRDDYQEGPQGDMEWITSYLGERQAGTNFKNAERSLSGGLDGKRARFGPNYVPQNSGYDTPEELDAIRSALLWGGYVTAEKYLSLGSSVLNAKENRAFTSLVKDLNETGSTIEEYLALAFEEPSSLGSSNSPGGGGGGGGKNVEQMDPEEIRQGVETISGQTLGKGIGSAERDQITDEIGSEATAASVADQQYDVESRTRRKLRERRPGDAAVTDIMSTFDAFASMMGAGGSFGQSSSQPESLRGPMTGAGGMR